MNAFYAHNFKLRNNGDLQSFWKSHLFSSNKPVRKYFQAM
jgi:hypothetical protein